jgi:hypothetical protein
LSVYASDPEDGILDGAQVVWTSDRDGKLGVGASLVVAPAGLSEGLHQLTAAATDSAGHQAAASVNVTVKHNDAPQLIADVVDDDIELSWPASYDIWQVQVCFGLDSSNWFPVSEDAEALGDQMVLRVPITDEAVYFRLVSP